MRIGVAVRGITMPVWSVYCFSVAKVFLYQVFTYGLSFWAKRREVEESIVIDIAPSSE
jgi:hypothetical protein